MTHREYEYMKPSNMPEWMKDFTDTEALKKKEGNYIDHINEILHPQSEPTSVEAMVSDLRDRVGLDLLTKKASDSELPQVTLMRGLLSLANRLDSEGKHAHAKKVDDQIQIIAKESKKESKKDDSEGLAEIVESPEFQELVDFIDKIVESRGGKVTAVSIQAMIENEKGMDVNPELQKYLEEKIESVRSSTPAIQEMSGPFGTDIQEPDRQANNEMFDMPETDM